MKRSSPESRDAPQLPVEIWAVEIASRLFPERVCEIFIFLGLSREIRDKALPSLLDGWVKQMILREEESGGYGGHEEYEFLTNFLYTDYGITTDIVIQAMMKGNPLFQSTLFELQKNILQNEWIRKHVDIRHYSKLTKSRTTKVSDQYFYCEETDTATCIIDMPNVRMIETSLNDQRLREEIMKELPKRIGTDPALYLLSVGGMCQINTLALKSIYYWFTKDSYLPTTKLNLVKPTPDTLMESIIVDGVCLFLELCEPARKHYYEVKPVNGEKPLLDRAGIVSMYKSGSSKQTELVNKLGFPPPSRPPDFYDSF